MRSTAHSLASQIPAATLDTEASEAIEVHFDTNVPPMKSATPIETRLEWSLFSGMNPWICGKSWWSKQASGWV